MSNFKVTSEKTHERGNTVVTTWFVNGINVATCKNGTDLYCSVKDGRRSMLRDRRRPTKETNWNYTGITELGIDIIDCKIFRNDYPDLTWGYTGSVLTKKQIVEIFSKYL